MDNETKYRKFRDKLLDEKYAVNMDVYIPKDEVQYLSVPYAVEFTTVDTTATSYEHLYGLNRQTYTFNSTEGIFPHIIKVFKKSLSDSDKRYDIRVFDDVEFYHYQFDDFNNTQKFVELAQVFQNNPGVVDTIDNKFERVSSEKNRYLIYDFPRSPYSHEEIIRELSHDDFESRIELGVVYDKLQYPREKSYVLIQVAYKWDYEFSGEEKYKNYHFKEDDDIFDELVVALQPAIKDKNITTCGRIGQHYVYKFDGIYAPNVVRDMRKIIHKNYQSMLKIAYNPAYKTAQDMCDTIGV